MSASRLLVISADGVVRRSLVFALEAEGFEVTESGVMPRLRRTDTRFDCTILDQRLLEGPPHESLAFCISSHPVVLLASRPHAFLVEWVSQVVETPIVEDALLNAVHAALRAGNGSSPMSRARTN